MSLSIYVYSILFHIEFEVIQFSQYINHAVCMTQFKNTVHDVFVEQANSLISTKVVDSSLYVTMPTHQASCLTLMCSVIWKKHLLFQFYIFKLMMLKTLRGINFTNQ